MRIHAKKTAALAVLGLLAACGVLAQSVYDPLKAAKVKPNIVIVIDNSSEMSKDVYGNEVGVDEFGTGSSWGAPVACSACGTCTKYTNYYRLLQGSQPSKMAILKNLLRSPVASPDPCTLKTFTYPALVLNAPYGEWKYVGLDTATGKPRFQTTLCPNKVPTTVPAITISNFTIAPQGLAASAGANLALVSFNGSGSAAVTVTLNASGGTDVAAMDAAMAKFSASGLGLVSPSVGRPINAGLYRAQQYLATLSGTCSRQNAILLMTSGYNSGSLPAWGGSCSTLSMTGPPSYADSSYNVGPPQRTRTFVYSMKDSPSVDNEACENNQTAYYGRTNSTAVNAGWGTVTLTTYAAANPYAFFKKIVDSVTRGSVVSWLNTVLAGPPDPADGDFTSSSATSFIQQSTGKPILLVPSVEFPGAKGHLYFYDLSTTPWTLLWDAATVLNTQSSRTIYTWNSSGALQRIDATADPAVLDAINLSFGGTPWGTNGPAIRDFIIGNGTGRWKLGPVINSVATVTGPADVWSQNFIDPRKDQTYGIEYLQQQRHQLVWVGSSDGMLHAFDAIDGAEVLAILPPNLLGLQATLQAQYAANPSWATGQSPSPMFHQYGVCSSPRWQDVAQYESNTNSPLLWKTLMFLTEGAGGNMIAALDITHPYPGRTTTVGTSTRTYPPDRDYLDTAPFGVQWFKTGGTVNNLPGQGRTWSVPAIMPVDLYPYWHCLFGSGDGTGTQVGYRLNAWDGAIARTISATAPGYGFPNGVLFKTDQLAPYPDNIANLGLLSDLNGNIRYSMEGSETVALALGASQPLYYSPAVMAYTDEASTLAYNLYAFASGSYFGTGPQANPPKIYIGSKGQTTSAFNASTEILPIPITSIPRGGEGVNFSAQAQVTTGAVMASGPPRAFFLVYDPAASGGVACFTGQTYVVQIDINPANLAASSTVPAANVFAAGAGVGTGMAVGGGVMIVTTSVVRGQQPFTAVTGVANLSSGSAPVSASQTPEWWFELK